MDETLTKLGEIGVIPVVTIDDARQASDLGRALVAGGLPVAEITFRTAAAEEAIRALARDVPELLVGAGTVLTTEQADRAIDAGARFIVAPGFNPRVVDHCRSRGVPITPGISSPTEIEMALERGLEVVKFFPAQASGGLEYLKAISAPFGGMRFIPTGGVDAANLAEYLAFPRVHAVGGTWIARTAAIAAGNFDEISRLANEAVRVSLGFELAHVGINNATAAEALAGAGLLHDLFSFDTKEGTSSIFAGTGFELMKSPFLGAHGHLALSTLNIPRAIAYLARKGVAIRPETVKQKDGRVTAVYLDRELAGFAIHLVQK
jgi:2-dehydro-3-deoxyphosphogluconate aldolase / (4S)-4-hydroxy-2-oxoglutarate aldolase